ncbi:MAG: DUF1987 family protein [Crocinitomicaceae bacterium]|nr:DUF1987 family protein [Crocinitomicaceae bacterium]
MENLILNGSDKTPYINLNQNGEMVFSGVSMPIDAAEFYFQIIEWFSDYYREPKPETVITVSFRYLNSSSESMIFKLFYCLDRLVQWDKSKVKCFWYFDQADESMEILIDRIKTYAPNISYSLYPMEDVQDAMASAS